MSVAKLDLNDLRTGEIDVIDKFDNEVDIQNIRCKWLEEILVDNIAFTR